MTCVGVTVKSEPDTCRIKRILLAPVGRVLHPLHEYGASDWKSNGGRTLMTPEYSTIYRASLSSPTYTSILPCDADQGHRGVENRPGTGQTELSATRLEKDLFASRFMI